MTLIIKKLPARSVFLTTAADPSLTLWMTPYRPLSFRALGEMLCENDGKQQYDTKRRIYYSGDILLFSPLRRQILLWHPE
ncbi:MAG: hypothetical protein U0M86_02210 [Dialister invisus]|uniref:hypothetical protein n=1 Tax=Dialister invisus TaxID=218538 RepID=UPI002F929CE9